MNNEKLLKDIRDALSWEPPSRMAELLNRCYVAISETGNQSSALEQAVRSAIITGTGMTQVDADGTITGIDPAQTREITLPFAKSIDEITHGGIYQTPDGLCRVNIYKGSTLPWVKDYFFTEKGLAGIIHKDGRHYTRQHNGDGWGAWELKP